MFTFHSFAPYCQTSLNVLNHCHRINTAVHYMLLSLLYCLIFCFLSFQFHQKSTVGLVNVKWNRWTKNNLLYGLAFNYAKEEKILPLSRGIQNTKKNYRCGENCNLLYCLFSWLFDSKNVKIRLNYKIKLTFL